MPETNLLNIFANRFWFAPDDVLLRAKEGLIWSDQQIIPPSLDIGCGDATISRILFKGHQPIDIGIDLDKSAVKKARQSNFYKKAMTVDAADMPFKAGSFQTVISNSTFEHIVNDAKAVAEVSRVLKPKGVFIFTVPSTRLQPYFSQPINRRVSHLHYRRLSDWRQLLKANGLKLVEAHYYLAPPTVKLWLQLFKLFTFKPYKRELWSYLQDSFLTPILPKKIFSLFIKKLLLPHYYPAFNQDGTWLFIKAVKQSK